MKELALVNMMLKDIRHLHSLVEKVTKELENDAKKSPQKAA